MPKLVAVELATGLPVREEKPQCDEIAAPGGLVHADIKQGGILDDGGSTAAGRADRRGSAVVPSAR